MPRIKTGMEIPDLLIMEQVGRKLLPVEILKTILSDIKNIGKFSWYKVSQI